MVSVMQSLGHPCSKYNLSVLFDAVLKLLKWCDDFSGAENKRGYLWDRHYGVHLRCFDHSDVVNSVAFNPRDQEMLVTVSDDNKVKVWRSRRRVRELLLRR